jgi:hypothetical protein
MMDAGSTGLGFQTRGHAITDLVKKQFPTRGNCDAMQPMTIQHSIQIGAAAISLAGVCLMYKFSGAGGPGGYVSAAIVEKARREGAQRLLWQRIGLALSILGIALSCASSFAT